MSRVALIVLSTSLLSASVEARTSLGPRSFKSIFRYSKQQQNGRDRGFLKSIFDMRRDRAGLKALYTPIHPRSGADWRRPRLRFRALPRLRARGRLATRVKLNLLLEKTRATRTKRLTPPVRTKPLRKKPLRKKRALGSP